MELLRFTSQHESLIGAYVCDALSDLGPGETLHLAITRSDDETYGTSYGLCGSVSEAGEAEAREKFIAEFKKPYGH